MSSSAASPDDPSTKYTLHELGQMLFETNMLIASTEKIVMSTRRDQEAFARQQTQVNKNLEDNMTKLLRAVEQLGQTTRTAVPGPVIARGWTNPVSVVIKSATFDHVSSPKLKLDPPRFDGANVTSLIGRVQNYYDHSSTPLADRLYLTQFLLDDAAAAWFNYWETNKAGRSWDEFLTNVKLRFDPELYEDYMGQQATTDPRDEETKEEDEPQPEEVVETKAEEATPPPPPATAKPSETVVEKVEDDIKETIVHEVTAPTPPACEEPATNLHENYVEIDELPEWYLKLAPYKIIHNDLVPKFMRISNRMVLFLHTNQ